MVADKKFDPLQFLPLSAYSKITDLRVARPGLPARLLTERTRRRMARDGRLTLLAADHPARMVTGIREEPLRMGARQEFLSRILRVVACSPFDGLLGTADVIEEVVLLSSLSRKGVGLLGGKLLIGSSNRGGLAGSSFELDDRVTGYDVDGAAEVKLDGVKFLLRFDPSDRDSLDTLSYCVDIVRKCAALKMPIFIEPLPVVRKEGRVVTENDRVKLIKLVGVVSGLGSSSSNIWLKLPYCDGFDQVAAATTLPILLLGGEASDDLSGLLKQIESAMHAGPNVRGVLMGRNLLYPSGDDPLPLAMAVNSMVHEGTGAGEAMESLGRWSGKDLDIFRPVK
jgi:DhnA family fructose-bisphosphate aldolase class Ia